VQDFFYYGEKMFKFIKKLLLTVVPLALFSTMVFAQSPTGPFTVVVPAPPGSAHDTSFRSVVPGLEKLTNVKFNIDYKPGAGGIVGTNHFLKLNDKSTTLFVGSSLSTVLSPISHPDVAKWDPLTDFQIISQLLVNPLVITVSSDSDIKNIDSLIVAMKEQDRVLKVGVTFANQKFIMLDIAKRLGTPESKIKFINYNNPANAITDLVNKNVDLIVGAISPTIPLQQAGKINWIAVTSKEPISFLPNVPTLNSKFPGLVQVSIIYALADKSMPKENVEWLRKLFNSAIMTPEAKDVQLKLKGFVDPTLQNPGRSEEFFKQVLAELGPIWADLKDK
jgi:tripartite-type tricarboxylate transporter receptor subunit TctC